MNSTLNKNTKIFVAGHKGLVGSALINLLNLKGYTNILVKNSTELDLCDQTKTYQFLNAEKPEVVIMCAAKVGGIQISKDKTADFMGNNLMMQHNVIWGSHLANVQQLLLTGSSYVYPNINTGPIPEEAICSEGIEPSNMPYAITKLAGTILCSALRKQFGRNYYTVMVPNIYGPNDNFNLQSAHVAPALIRKFYEALPDKPVKLLGTGKAKREFIHSYDVAEAFIFLIEKGGIEGHINIGWGKSVSIRDLALLVQKTVDHTGPIIWDQNSPEGFSEKTLNSDRIQSLGWQPQIPLPSGLKMVYESFFTEYQKFIKQEKTSNIRF